MVLDKTKRGWWKSAVFYQIYPKSFQDTTGDGMGDIPGIISRLDYLEKLGIDGIWLSPVCQSPQVDNGYDISDYMDIAQEFGGMEAFKKMLDAAHERGMKVIMDLVVNHTSTQHEWFQKSRQRIEPYTDYYIWRPAKPGGKLPNNWDSLFEGKAWAWDEVRKEYYMHLFAIEQADLNMDNPLVREEVKKILRFWLDMGVDGFREDVITYISKAEGLPDDHLFPVYKGMLQYNHGPHIHEYLAEFKRDVFDHYDCFTLAEAPLVWPKQALKYIQEKARSYDKLLLDHINKHATDDETYVAVSLCLDDGTLLRVKRSWTAKGKKVKAACIDGGIRDTHQILEADFPIFYEYRISNGSLGRCLITHYQTPIKIGDVTIKPGDLILGDNDGVLVVPREIAYDVLVRAEEIKENEKKIFSWVHEGQTIQEIKDKVGYF